MNRRLITAASVVLAFTVGIVAPARAQEIHVATPMTSMGWVTADGSPEIRRSLTVARMHAEQALPFQLDPPMKEVRLSSGAKTAIIITAIVVGALIIVGAIALSRPGKKLP
jgi:hypothetical protein